MKGANALWTLPVAFTVFWTSDRLYSYFSLSEDEMYRGFVSEVLPENATYTPLVASGFYKDGIQPSYSSKYVSLRVHIVSAAIMAACCLLNATPFIRKASYTLHRIIGYTYVAALAVFTVTFFYVQFIEGMMPVGLGPKICTWVAMITMLVATPLAIYYARTKQYEAHRVANLYNMAALFYIPLQRFLWLPCSKYALLGPVVSWEHYKELVISNTSYWAVLINYSVATYMAFGNKRNAGAKAPNKAKAN